MNAIFDSNGLKVFARTLKFLARIGNELYFEARDDELVLKTINSSSTCLLQVSFNQYFFSQFEITNGTAPEDNVFCISARPLLQALKNVHNVSSFLKVNKRYL